MHQPHGEPSSDLTSEPRARRWRRWAAWLTVAAVCWISGADQAIAGAAVVLDTGHTPNRPGTTGANGKREYDYNLALSNQVAAELAAAGLTVIRVASDGHDVALKDRTASSASAALFVSVHHDSIQQAWIDDGRAGEYSGFSVFVSGKNQSQTKSLFCARSVGEALRGAGEKPSLYHAMPIKGENRPLVDQARGVHRFDDLVVLKSAASPAILIEAGVIANPREAVRLAQVSTVDLLGRQIASAIVRCLGSDSGRLQ